MRICKRIELPLPGGDRIVVEKSGDMYPEIYIGIVNRNNMWVQELVCVRAKFEYSKPSKGGNYDLEIIKDMYQVLVWGDSHSDDYTAKFDIERTNGNEEV